jgi:hypothetical protein
VNNSAPTLPVSQVTLAHTAHELQARQVTVEVIGISAEVR